MEKVYLVSQTLPKDQMDKFSCRILIKRPQDLHRFNSEQVSLLRTRVIRTQYVASYFSQIAQKS